MDKAGLLATPQGPCGAPPNKKRAIEIARFQKFMFIDKTYGAFPTHHNTLANIFHLRFELSVTDS
jgi:hypothetical protein